MIIRKAYKYRLKVRSTVANIFSQAAGCCRLVWNKALALQKELLDNEESVLNYSKLCKQLSEWKKNEDFAFLRQVHSQPLQQSVKALDRALRECFGKKKGFPKFKKRGVQDSFSYPQGVRVEGNEVFLPKIGSIPFFQSSKLQGKIKNATVSKRGKFWFVSIQVEQEVKEPVHSSKSKVGIDMGVCRFATLSDGSVIYPLNSFKKLEKKLAKEQKALSRKLKFSNNWKRQRQKVSQVHIRIADARRDFLHKCSTKISENQAVIVMEDLSIRKMTCSIEDAEGKRDGSVKKKRRLNKSILDQGWYEFRRQLEYKQLWRGGKVHFVNPAGTSRRCPSCNYESKSNRKSQSSFVCVRCGLKGHADYIAALNILMAVGHTASACGDIKSIAA